jgi:hypothetical protein
VLQLERPILSAVLKELEKKECLTLRLLSPVRRSVCETVSATIAGFSRNSVFELFTKCCRASVSFVKTGSVT